MMFTLKSLTLAIALGSTLPAFAGSFYVCSDNDRRDMVFIVDFENLDISTVSLIDKKVLAVEKMLSAQPEFFNIGDSLSKSQEGYLDGQGRVIIENRGGQFSGTYKGSLTFGDLWTFQVCLAGQD